MPQKKEKNQDKNKKVNDFKQKISPLISSLLLISVYYIVYYDVRVLTIICCISIYLLYYQLFVVFNLRNVNEYERSMHGFASERILTRFSRTVPFCYIPIT